MRILLIILSTVFALLMVGAGGLYLLLAWAFWEPDGVEAGSAAYLLAIPSTAKDVPLWQPCGQATYSYRFQDGMSPATYWIDYETRLSGAAFESAIAKYAKAQTCKIITQPEMPSVGSNAELAMTCGTGSPIIRLAFSRRGKTASACHPVRVLFIEDLH